MGSYQSRMYTVYIYKYIYQAIVEDKESYEYAYTVCMCVVLCLLCFVNYVCDARRYGMYVY